MPWLIALLLLIPFVVFTFRHPDALGSQDSVHNLCIARSISEGKGFTLNTIIQFCEHEEFGEADTIRTPVTPWAIGALMRVLGPTAACARIYNLALLLAILAVIGRLAILLHRALPLRKRLSSWVDQGAWVVPLFVLFGSFHFVHAWDNNLFTLMVLVTLWLFMEPRLHAWLRPVLFGFVVALGTLNKATFAVFCAAFFGLTLLLWLLVRGRKAWRRVLGVAAGGALGLLILTPWAIGNVQEYGRVFPGKLLPTRWEVTYPGVRLGLGSSQIQYDVRVSFDDVVETLGYRGMLRAHLEHAKDYFGNRPFGVPFAAFVVLLLAGVVALRRSGLGLREGLRGLPPALQLYGVAALASLATSFFVCVLFWFFELRYTYHSIVLCSLAVFMGARLVADRLRGKAAWVCALGVLALLPLRFSRGHRAPLRRTNKFLKYEYLAQERYRKLGEWARRETPEDAVFTTGDMWAAYFTWDTRRRAFWIPAWVKGTPEDVGVAQQLELLDRMRVTYMLFDTVAKADAPDRLAPFRPLLRRLEADGRVKERVEGEGYLVVVLRPAAR